MGNFRTDPESARYVVANWPTMLTFTGGGAFAEQMAIGRKITALDPNLWPVRHGADSIATFVAVRGFEPYFNVVERGHNEIDEIGRNAWKGEPDAGNQRYTSELLRPADAPKIAAILEDLATQVPKAGSSPSRGSK